MARLYDPTEAGEATEWSGAAKAQLARLLMIAVTRPSDGASKHGGGRDTHKV